jgi:hypothetical protein
MLSSLFIYSLAGLFEILNLIMWTILAILWNLNNGYTYPIIHVVNAPVLILFVYFILNITHFICFQVKIRSDRKFKGWEIQDNKCISHSITFISLFFTFRFDLLRFCKIGHFESFSARVTNP